MGKKKSLGIVCLSVILFGGCQSMSNQGVPSGDEELRSEMKQQESKRIYNEYMLQQSIMRQREEVARNQQRERQRQQQQQNSR